MKTKNELLKKYEGNEKFYGVIKAHYGTKTSFQDYDGSILDFNIESMKDIVGGDNLTYEDFIDIQIQTGNNYRGSFMLCYHYITCGFMGEVEKFSKSNICFKRIYVVGMFPDGNCFEGKEEHVWMDIKGFETLKVGDCVSFFAEPYKYIKTSNGKRLEYGLRNPEEIKKIDKYELPTDEDLMKQDIDNIICGSCYLAEQCDGINCFRNKKELRELRKSMLEALKNSK